MSQTGYATLIEAVEDLTRRGFTEHFEVVGGALRARESGKTFRAEELLIRECHRFEGVSDPDDMSIVYAIESHRSARDIGGRVRRLFESGGQCVPDGRSDGEGSSGRDLRRLDTLANY